jgi:RNA polymerase sigma factor (sigma-70 family)
MMSDIRVVIADDHKLFRLGLRQLINKQPGIAVVAEAATGFEAVNATRDHSPDVVLMDISMPELNGIEAARQIAEAGGGTNVIILSMHTDRRYIIEALHAGARGYLLKDSAAEEVFRAIHKVTRGQLYLSRQINERVIEEFIQRSHVDMESAYSVLSAREREVLQLVAEGKSTRDIAEKLNLSAKTIETHRLHIMDKLNLHTVAELTKYAIKEGLISLE